MVVRRGKHGRTRPANAAPAPCDGGVPGTEHAVLLRTNHRDKIGPGRPRVRMRCVVTEHLLADFINTVAEPGDLVGAVQIQQ